MARWDGYVKTQKPCSNEKCDNLVWKGKYCTKCYSRIRSSGDPNITRRVRHYKYNENFITEQTKETYWFLGWMASDGHVNKNLLNFSLEICDKEIVDKCKDLIGYTGEVKLRKAKKEKFKDSYRLLITNKKMTKDLVDFGITPAKSKTIQLPKIDDEDLFYHFLRGVIEGDGSLVTSQEYIKKRLFIFLNSASKEFLEKIAERIGLKYKIREKKKGVWRLIYWDNKAIELCERLYKDSDGIRLQRKYDKYLDFSAHDAII